MEDSEVEVIEMIKITHKVKGFTLIELILALAIMSIVMLIVLPFFLSNYRSLNVTSSKSQLQHDAQMINELISKKLMEANKILIVEDTNDVDVTESIEEKSISYIKYLNGEMEENTLEVKSDGLYYKNLNNSEEKTVKAHIQEVLIEPINGIDTYSKTSAIRIIVKLSVEDIKYETDNNVYFRNKD
ncbi:PilW family protein [Alloiococcus sp. CFN-8]|uniref:PilW family protein n=1 Tax=Alloiococcus sp. CFN-8 TaxID=3416081 RepID=UPI003CF51564